MNTGDQQHDEDRAVPDTTGTAPSRGIPWGSILRNCALVITILVLVWLALNVRLPSIPRLRDNIADLGWIGPLAFVGLYAVVAITPIPVTVMAVVGGMVFGLPIGTVLSLVGVSIGCWIAYGIARGLGRTTVLRLLGTHAPTVRGRLENGGFFAVCTLRLMPGIPYWPVNYGAGAFGISNRDFLVATILASLPGQLSLVAVGAFLSDPTVFHGVFLGASWLLVIVLTVVAWRRWREDDATAERAALR